MGFALKWALFAERRPYWFVAILEVVVNVAYPVTGIVPIVLATEPHVAAIGRPCPWRLGGIAAPVVRESDVRDAQRSVTPIGWS